MSNFQRKLLKINKGITLIELIVAIGLCTIIISMILPIFLKFNFLYNKLIINTRNDSYANEAILFIKNEMDKNTSNISVNSNKIIIGNIDGVRKEIYFSQRQTNLGNIVVTYYENVYSSSTNNILRNIKAFTFNKKGNLIYIKIVTLDGRSFERCLNLKL